jgi:hypothetical protein
VFADIDTLAVPVGSEKSKFCGRLIVSQESIESKVFPIQFG